MFQDQTIVATGSSYGISRGVEERIAAEGRRIVIWDADGGLVCAETCAAGGRIEALIHTASIAGPKVSLVEYDIGNLADILAMKFNGTFHVNRSIVPVMQAQNYSRIVKIAAVAGKVGTPISTAIPP